MDKITMKGISKRFSSNVLANDSIDLSIKAGEIHAIVGENGAGKTTLMKILYGMYQPDTGQILIDGKEVKIQGPDQAINLGIGMVHQHFMLISSFTVLENIILGIEPHKKNFELDKKTAMQLVREKIEKFGIEVNLQAKISSLPVGLQQRVEILKVLYRGAEILILDEPTAVLTPQESIQLFKTLKVLAKAGNTILFITHKLKEVLAISDRVSVLRRGILMGTLQTKNTDEKELANLMVGRDVVFTSQAVKTQKGKNRLSIHNISCIDERGVTVLNNINFSVREGEIFGIAGVMGNGQTELVEILTGLRKATEGTFVIDSTDVTNFSVRELLDNGLAHITEDRHQRGLILDFSVSDNLLLGFHHKLPFCKNIFLQHKKIESFSNKLVKDFDIRTDDINILAKSLSGGNQQKVVLARELAREPRVIIASQPTRGLDVGAIEFVRETLLDYKKKGSAIVLLSLELDEILSISDRIGVLYKGELADIVDREQATEQMIGALMLGQTKEDVHSVQREDS